MKTVSDTFDDIVVTLKKMNKCEICNKNAPLLCGKCKSVSYCSKECQKKDWTDHKKICGGKQMWIDIFKGVPSNLEFSSDPIVPNIDGIRSLNKLEQISSTSCYLFHQKDEADYSSFGGSSFSTTIITHGSWWMAKPEMLKLPHLTELPCTIVFGIDRVGRTISLFTYNNVKKDKLTEYKTDNNKMEVGIYRSMKDEYFMVYYCIKM